MTDKEKIQSLFRELGLPIETSSWSENTEQILNGAAYITFDENGKVTDYHGGYE